jgi:transposase
MQRKSYSRQFEVDVVRLVADQGYKISEAAWNPDIHPNILRKWKGQLTGDSEQTFPSKGHATPEKEELCLL